MCEFKQNDTKYMYENLLHFCIADLCCIFSFCLFQLSNSMRSNMYSTNRKGIVGYLWTIIAMLTCVICWFLGVPYQLKPEVLLVCHVRKRVLTAKIPPDWLERNVPSKTIMYLKESWKWGMGREWKLSNKGQVLAKCTWGIICTYLQSSHMYLGAAGLLKMLLETLQCVRFYMS